MLKDRPVPGGPYMDLAVAGGTSVNALDFAPLFRTAIGFDRLARLADSAAATSADTTYPPYNIEKTGDDAYRITMAVAGFGPEDIELTVKENTLFVAGRTGNSEGQKAEVLYRGIAGRAFERRFVLADHIVVDGADLLNGLLHVNLKRVVPEQLKPRRIPVGSGSARLSNEPSSNQGGANDTGAASKAA
jgi:molecular chaperone IbpA